MRRRIAYSATVVAVAAMAVTTNVLAAGAAGPQRAPRAARAGDVDGDGRADLAVGAPDGTIGGKKSAGYVTLVRGAASGVTTANSDHIDQASPGVPGTPEAGDHFGESTALADVNGDGHADLIAGAPEENVANGSDPGTDAGSVTIVYGGASGLTGKAIAFHAPTLAAYEHFGESLAAGDFNHDGRTDVAITSEKRIYVLYGAASLPATPKLTAFVPPDGEAGVTRAAAGDVNGDGYADLTAEYYSDDPADEGTIGVFAGSASGLATKPDGTAAGLGAADYEFAVGDVTGDGHADLVIGTSGEDEPEDSLLRLYKGTAHGYDVAHPVTWTGTPVTATPTAIGDIDGDGYGDLVAYVSRDDDSGEVMLVRGSASGLASGTVHDYVQGGDGIPGAPENGDTFGVSDVLTDLTGDGHLDLAAGSPGENETGAIVVMPGTGSGLATTGIKAYGPGSFGGPATYAEFGYTVS